MFAILLLSSISRCASPALCPSDEELMAAVLSREAAAAARIVDEAALKGEIVLIHLQQIRGIKQVVCGDRLPGDLPAAACKMTVRYWSTEVFQVAKLVPKGGTWHIGEVLGVVRDRH